MGLQVGFAALLLLVIALAGSTFRILREYERGVVFQLGRFWQVKGPGLILLIPVVQQMDKRAQPQAINQYFTRIRPEHIRPGLIQPKQRPDRDNYKDKNTPNSKTHQ